jgi:drug/metabolite transporter (DMT)-like permease
VSSTRRGVLWILTSAFAYSLFTVFGKNVLEQLRTTDVLFWRFAIAVPISWSIVALRQSRGVGARVRDVRWMPPFMAGVSFGLMAYVAFESLERLSGAVYIVLCYTYPAMVAIGAWFVGKPTSRQLWGAVVLTLVGVALTFPEISSGTDGRAITGMFLTLANSFIYACYILYSEKLVGTNDSSLTERPTRHVHDGFVTAAWGLTGSLVFALVVVATVGGVGVPSGHKYVWSMLGLGVIGTVVSTTAFLLGVRYLGPAPAALVASIEPAITLLWVVLFLGESLAPVQLVGAALVISGVIWSQRSRRVGPINRPEPEVLAP